MWDDCQQILCTLFITVEKEYIFMKAAEALSGIASIINDQRVEAIGTFFQVGDPIVTITQREVGGLLVNTTRFY